MPPPVVLKMHIRNKEYRYPLLVSGDVYICVCVDTPIHICMHACIYVDRHTYMYIRYKEAAQINVDTKITD